MLLVRFTESNVDRKYTAASHLHQASEETACSRRHMCLNSYLRLCGGINSHSSPPTLLRRKTPLVSSAYAPGGRA